MPLYFKSATIFIFPVSEFFIRSSEIQNCFLEFIMLYFIVIVLIKHLHIAQYIIKSSKRSDEGFIDVRRYYFLLYNKFS